jgi:RNA polymerase sigma-70 factor, ECF subfamily
MKLPWPWRRVQSTTEPILPEAVPTELEPAFPDLSKPGFVDEAIPHMASVYRFALRLTGGNDAEADDVLQETFIRAYRSWESYTTGTQCRSWLFTICRNEFLRERSRAGAHTASANLVGEADAEVLAAATVFQEAAMLDPEAAFFESIVDRQVIAAIDALPVEFRETVVLSDLQGFSYPEVAEILQVPVGTVKSRLYRARRLLQESLYEYAMETGYTRRRGKK